jgi:hypothetical protein
MYDSTFIFRLFSIVRMFFLSNKNKFDQIYQIRWEVSNYLKSSYKWNTKQNFNSYKGYVNPSYYHIFKGWFRSTRPCEDPGRIRLPHLLASRKNGTVLRENRGHVSQQEKHDKDRSLRPVYPYVSKMETSYPYFEHFVRKIKITLCNIWDG